jgi:methionyl-tRNA formyltransferase
MMRINKIFSRRTAVKIVFMGTSKFAVPSLIKLIESSYGVVGVISQPDRPRGRGKRISYTPVKEAAVLHNVRVFQPSSIKDPAALELVKSLKPDLIVVVAYGQIIPRDILTLPPLGCINVHASLLPRYRGAAPIQRAIMAGEKITGISTMFMDEGLDTGDIILQTKVAIADSMDHGQLESLLADEGAELLMKTVDLLASRQPVPRTKQDNNQASYASMIKSEDELIIWSDTAERIINQVRALSPQPGAYTFIGGEKLKIFRCQIDSTHESGVIGQVVKVAPKSFSVVTGKGILEILEVQKAGKKRMPSGEFLKGYSIKPGTVMGNQGDG